MKRGEIWLCVGFKDLGKVRPWLVVQSDRFADFEGVTACPITSDPDARIDGIRLALEPSRLNRLDAPSVVMIDKVSTLPKARIRERVGRLSAPQIVQVDGLLMRWLGL